MESAFWMPSSKTGVGLDLSEGLQTAVLIALQVLPLLERFAGLLWSAGKVPPTELFPRWLPAIQKGLKSWQRLWDVNHQRS